MSMEEVELKDLITETLKANGTLAKIKAQLRASIFLALDEDEKISRQKPLFNNRIKTFMESNEGKSMFYVVHEFLEFFNLSFTLSVYEPESYLDCQCQKEEKQRIAQQFGLGSVEETSEPLLYQILKIAQKTKRNLEVNINVNGNVDEETKSDSIHSETESISVPEIVCSGSNSEDHNEVPLEVTNGIKEPPVMNSTFDVLSPIMHSKPLSHNHNENNAPSAPNETLKNLDSTYNRKPNDDTYNDTSSLLDDILDSTNEEKVPEIKQNGLEETEVKLNDKPKLSPPKSEKLKSKSNLSSLSDLPPIKATRVNDILPSLYNKDFKDKSNMRELDKLFDMDVEYEEDFMYSGDDLSVKSERSNVNLLEELKQSARELNRTSNSNDKTVLLGKKEAKAKGPSRIISDCTKVLLKTTGNPQKSKSSSEASEVNSIISENLENTSE